MGATSPAAREIAKIAPVMIPGMAWGRTILKIVSSFEAPKARLASRRPWGMARRDSSVATITTGRVITASVKEAHRIEGWLQFDPDEGQSRSRFRPTKLMKKPTPKRPNTIDGTPARLLTAPRMKRVTGEVLWAYAVR